MPHVRIHQVTKTATQSGKGLIKKWILEFEPSAAKDIEPLMGWVSSSDTHRQIKLSFDTPEQAIAFAQKNGFTWEVEQPIKRVTKPKSYSDNFRFDRRRD